MLFEIDRHEQCITSAWSEEKVRDSIERILHETTHYFLEHKHWLVTAPEFIKAPEEHAALFMGAAGVLLALHRLAPELITDEMREYTNTLASLNRENLLNAQSTILFPLESYGLMQGLGGIDWVRYRLFADDSSLIALLDSLEKNLKDKVLDIMWSAPGTMLIALQIYQETGSKRALAIFQEQAQFMWDCWERQPDSDLYLWLQDIYGAKSTLLGMVHGVAGNLLPFIKGIELLPDAMQAALYPRIASTMLGSVIYDGEHVNWPQSYGKPRPGRDAMLMQVCHGAPGVIISLIDCFTKISPEFDRLLLQAGETTWQAGPLKKPSGLCHGTAGNGYAFLSLYRVTGDEKYLQRARAFAMHAIAQAESEQQHHGLPYYSLWLGDLGLACYLQDCLQGTDHFPLL